MTLLHFDLAVITLWFAVTTAQFRYDEVLLYPMALYFTFAFFRDWQVTWPVFQKGFVLLLLPSWWLLSTLWSPEPALAFRSGLQVFLTILICMFMASKLSIRQLLIVILLALLTAALRSLPQSLYDLSVSSPSKAIYTHKNALGMNMAILLSVSVSLLLSEKSYTIKIISLISFVTSILLIFSSQSATAILISIGIIGIVICVFVCIGNNNTFSYIRLFILSCIISIFFSLIIIFINFIAIDPIDLVLNALGKDRSLTGRTDLWHIAISEIEERPLLGTGAKGYWRYHDSHIVRQIFIDYHREEHNIFHFHNSWLEICVNLGIVGLFLSVISFIWAISVIFVNIFILGGINRWSIFAISIAILLRTMTEADLFNQFVMLHMILWTGALILAANRRKVL